MNPLSLKLRNVRTFDQIELDLPEGLLAVLGENGAGKSTLINAIDVALFGAVGRSLADWVPRDGSDDPLVVELVFEHGAAMYRVRRSYSPKGRGQSKLDLEKESNGLGLPSEFWEPLTEESAARTQEVIEEIVGLSRDTFRASAFLAQGEAGVFCEAQPRQRKTILAEILGLGEWERWLERAREQKRETETELARIAGALERAEEELAQRDSVVKAYAEADDDLVTAKAEVDVAIFSLTRARAAHAEAVERQSARKEASEAVTRARIALRQVEERLGSSEAEVEALRERLTERDALVVAAESFDDLAAKRDQFTKDALGWAKREDLMQKIETAQSSALAHDTAATDARAKATKILSGVGAERCDRCDQILHQEAAERAAASFNAEADRHQQDSTELLTQIPRLMQDLDGLPYAAPDDLEMQRNLLALEEARRAREQLAALTEVEQRVVALDAALTQMRAEKQSRESELLDASRTAERLGPHNPAEVDEAFHKVAVLEHEEREFRAAVETLSGSVARHAATLERIDKIAEEAKGSRLLREAYQAEHDLHVAMERACGPNGVPALILENVAIPQIEAEATRILGELGGPAHAVELHTLKQTKTAGVADTLDIVLLTDTGAAPYESFSGGERARISFALRLALAQLLANRKGAQTGLLVIDEIDGLDEQGVHALVRVLEELQRSVPRIIVVSHDAQLRDAFEQTIYLENVDGRSRIVETQTEVPA